jgi:hypothetical protein
VIQLTPASRTRSIDAERELLATTPEVKSDRTWRLEKIAPLRWISGYHCPRRVASLDENAYNWA